MMKAVFCDRPQRADEMQWVDVEMPKPGYGEMLVKVNAFGLNLADIYQRKGNYPPPPGASSILGMEVAGEVVALGSPSAKFKIGDRVMSLITGGGYAQYAVVPMDLSFHVPTHLSIEEAAGLPEVMFVAQMALFDLARLKPGQKVLLHGGSSGISSFAIQICKALGVQVATTVRNEEKQNYVKRLGADLAIQYSSEDFAECILRHPDFGKVDVILDFIGAPYLERNLQILARFGHLVMINSAGGDEAKIDLGNLIVGCQSVHGTVLRSRPFDQKVMFAEGGCRNILPMIEAKKIKSFLGKVFSAEQLAEAHEMMECSKHLGKLVVRPPLL